MATPQPSILGRNMGELQLRAMYGTDGGVRDRLTDFSNPASGSFSFARSVDMLDGLR